MSNLEESFTHMETSRRWPAVLSGVMGAVGGVVRWLGETFQQLAPVVIRWSALTLIAGFATVAVIVVSIENKEELVFGLIDRSEAERHAEREHLLDMVAVAKGYAEAEYGPGATLRQCQTVDYKYIWFD